MSALVRSPFVAAVVLLLGMSALDAQAADVPRFDPGDARTSFTRMAHYLAAEGGRWRAANPSHDPSRGNSPPAFGLWFDRVLGGRVLELSIVVHYGDSTVLSSKGHWIWHPGDNELKYVMVARNGSVTEGVTSFPDAATFTTFATLTRPRGGTSDHRDDNVLVSESVHRNETFERSPAGEWVSGGVYVWEREPPPG